MATFSESQAQLREEFDNVDEKGKLRARVVEVEREDDLLKQAPGSVVDR